MKAFGLHSFEEGENVLSLGRCDFGLVAFGEAQPLVSRGVRVDTRVAENLTKRAEVVSAGRG
jgi:hypothetical protein